MHRTLLALVLLAAPALAAPTPKLDTAFGLPVSEGTAQVMLRFEVAAGQYTGVVAILGSDGKLVLQPCLVSFGQSAPPTPPPEPLSGIALSVKTMVLDTVVVSPTRIAEATALAKSFRSVAAQVAAGTVTDLAAVIKATAEANNTALGTARQAWLAWSQKLRELLNAEQKAGRLKTAADGQRVWGEIATGLEAVR